MTVMLGKVLNQQNKGDKYFKRSSYLLTYLIFEFCIFNCTWLVAYTHKILKRE